MSTSMRFLTAALFSAVLLLDGAFTAFGTTASRAADQQSLRVGYFPNLTHAQALLGFGEGAFAQALPGVSVRGTVFNAGPDELTALFAGAIDIGYIGPGPAINGFVRSHGGIVVIAGVSNGGSILVARAGSGIKTLKDLAGKTVAIPQIGNTQDILLRSLLAGSGLKSSDSGGSVRVLAVQNPDTLTLFEKKDLDAALVPEPWGSRLIAATGASVVLDWQQIYGGTTPAAVVVVNSAFLSAHRDLVVRFLRVHNRLTQELQQPGGKKNTASAALNAQIKALTGKALPPAVLAAALSRTAFTTTINQTALSQFAGFSITAGYLRAGVSLGGLVNPWPLAHLQDTSIN